MVNKNTHEYEDGPFDRENLESLDKIIPFDAEDELPTSSDTSEFDEADDEESVLLMGPASPEIDIADIVDEKETDDETEGEAREG